MVWASLLLVVLVSFFWRYLRRSSKPPLPPGPRGYPIIGNLLDMPNQNVGQRLFEIGQELGTDIVHLNVAGSSIVSLNSFQACEDLLSRRSNIYSSRPYSTMIMELMPSWSRDMGALPYGNDWKIRRKLFHHSFPKTNEGSRHYEHILKANRIVLQNILRDPDNYRSHLSFMAGSLILDVIFGINAKTQDDPHLVNAREVFKVGLVVRNPGTFMVDTLPWLKYIPSWFPGAGFKKKAKEWSELHEKMGREAYEYAMGTIDRGEVRSSFVSDVLEATGGKIDQQVLIDTTAVMYEAGAETTYTAILTFILAMTCFPEYQVKAREEIERVIGPKRLPDFQDWNQARIQLPYCEAVMRECLRWQPIAPGAVPHAIEVDDEYRGYWIPKNSTIIANVWAIFYDENMYPNPHIFNPDRWILDGKINPAIRDTTASFGFGRRICPGRHFALLSMFVTMTTILAVFDIEKAVDKNGNVIEPGFEFEDNLQHRARPFPCRIKPRSEFHAAMIRDNISTTE